MHVTYAPQDPADGDRQQWDLDLRRMRQSEAEQIEKAFGGTKDEFDQAVLAGNSKARKVLLWHLMRREHPRMQLRDVPDFYTDEVEVELDVAELERTRRQLVDAPGLSDGDRAQMLDVIDAQLATLAERKAAEPEGKALSPTAPTATG